MDEQMQENETTEVIEFDEEDTPDQEQEQEQEQVPETFPREYVEELRGENAKWRTRAQKSDDLSKRLHAALVRETGRLADPSDLEFAAEHLEDADTLTAAIDDLLERKPHLASRRARGDIGQGATPTVREVSLADLLRQGV